MTIEQMLLVGLGALTAVNLVGVIGLCVVYAMLARE